MEVLVIYNPKKMTYFAAEIIINGAKIASHLYYGIELCDKDTTFF